MRQLAVNVMANGRNGAIYVGVTSNLPQRAYEQRLGARPTLSSSPSELHPNRIPRRSRARAW
jgi:predicted GIY-YIG superfamily endonuclease